jgi:hypothetical protein
MVCESSVRASACGSRRDILNGNAPLETVSPIRLLKIDASPRGFKSNSIALTDAFVTAYRDAVPSVTVVSSITARCGTRAAVPAAPPAMSIRRMRHSFSSPAPGRSSRFARRANINAHNMRQGGPSAN